MELAIALLLLVAQPEGPAVRAYRALRAKEYDTAIVLFQEAARAAPANAALRKDLAYTYLKTGETEAARDEFAEAMKLDAADERVALEYAFLCNDTRRTAEARRVFDRLRKTGAPSTRETAARAFDNIDRPLAEGIARWSAVVTAEPANFSAHLELARLCEQRDEPEAAAREYRAAWKLRPADRGLLVGAGRALIELGKTAEANALLLAASRGGRPRAAEEARELLPRRYPYVSEFRAALELDPDNAGLRRELGFLLLQMGRKEEAEREFEAIAPRDLLAAAQLGFLRLERHDRAGAIEAFEPVLKSGDDEMIARIRSALRLPPDLRRRRTATAEAGGVGPKEMGERSYRAGYLADALKYFLAASEADPRDSTVMLRLGQVYNLLRRDDQAVGWFDRARNSPDPAVAAEAARAYNNLRPQFARWRVTAWAFPFYSSRWRDLFAYAQVKAEMRVGRLPVRPYVSLRFIGDTRQTTGTVLPQYLSENSFLLGVGLATGYWHGAMLWGEAGSAVRYTGAAGRGRMVPDYRGGVSFARGKGHLLGGGGRGWFAETHEDGVFVSRFDNDFLAYSQNQAGYTTGGESWRAQLYWNGNLTMDVKRQYWANFAEFGPGARLRWAPLPAVFSVNLLRGAYLRKEQNALGPAYSDLRVGFWYAATR